MQPLHCFIPSISALAFKNNNFNWNDNVVNRNLLCNNEIWYDNYYIPPTNESHITLTTDNVAWVAQEIDKGQPNCPKICSFSLNGPTELCVNTIANYTLDVPIPAGYAITFDPSPKYQVISISTTGIVIKPIQVGSYSISMRIVNPCGADALIKKEVFVGTLQAHPQMFINGTAYNAFSSVCLPRMSQYTISIDPVLNATSYFWSIGQPYAVSLNNGQGTNSIDVTVFGSPGNDLSFSVQPENACGKGSGLIVNGQVCGTGSGGIDNFRLSPNPASDIIKVESVNNIKEILEIRILDKLGNYVKAFKYTKGNFLVNFSIASLPKDIYYLEIFDGAIWTKKQISKL